MYQPKHGFENSQLDLFSTSITATKNPNVSTAEKLKLFELDLL